MTKILVTGGAGYIGSHTCVELLNANYDIVVADDLRNSKEEALRRVRKLTGRDFPFIRADVCDEAAMEALFAAEAFDGIIHFAGLKAVGESVEQPLAYYRNNLDATLTLLACMKKFGVERIIFSSSATVYGAPRMEETPSKEDAPRYCNSPYGWTKYMSEQILRDCAAADARLCAIILRYFNPVGAHESGMLGEEPQGTPNNLMPYIAGVDLGRYPYLRVFGDDYETPDGTGVRDYIHVVDLARGHVAALAYAMTHTGVEAINLGTGRGYSVLEIANAYERVNGVTIPRRILPRRPGDVPIYCADTQKARRLLGFRAEKTLEDMCASTRKWLLQNPNGYGDA